MYGQFYGLTDEPFRLSPDARFCFQHRSFSRAKSYFHYALGHREGFVLVTGQPGTGKTTLIDTLLGELDPSRVLSVRIESAQVGGDDLVRRVAYAFGLRGEGLDKATLLNNLERFLAERVQNSGTALLIVDEAQALPPSALEELRLITNIRPFGHPVIQIFLVGQEALRERIRSPELEQLHQRILCACHLDPLSLGETRDYIEHRLQCAGWAGDPVIEAGAVRVVHASSGGIPRLINKFSDRLLLHGSLEELHQLGVAEARAVLAELSEELLLNESTGSTGQADDSAIESPRPGDEEEIRSIDFDEESEPPPTLAARQSLGAAEFSPAAAYSPLGSTQVESISLIPGGGISDSPIRPRPAGYGSGSAPSQVRRVEPPRSFNLQPSDEPIHGERRPGRPTSTGHGRSGKPDQRPVNAGPVETRHKGRGGLALGLTTLLLLGVGYFALQRASPESESDWAEWLDWQRLTQWLGQLGSTETDSGQMPAGHAAKTDPARSDPSLPESASTPAAALAGSSRSQEPSNESIPATEAPDPTVPPGVHNDMASAIASADPQMADGDAPEASRPAPVLTDTSNLGGPGRTSDEGAAAPIPRQTDSAESRALGMPGGSASEIGATDTGIAESEGVLEGAAAANDERPRSSEPETPAKSAAADSALAAQESEVSRISPVADTEAQVTPASVARGSDASQAPEATTSDNARAVDLAALSAQLEQLGLTPAGTGEAIRVNLQEKVPFDFDSVALPADAEPVLNRLAELLSEHTGTRVTVIGHTDALGNDAYNRRLSLRRAQTVSRYLTDRGIEPGRLSSVGRGEEEPLEIHNDEELSNQEARSRNRRIELLIELNDLDRPGG